MSTSTLQAYIKRGEKLSHHLDFVPIIDKLTVNPESSPFFSDECYWFVNGDGDIYACILIGNYSGVKRVIKLSTKGPVCWSLIVSGDVEDVRKPKVIGKWEVKSCQAYAEQKSGLCHYWTIEIIGTDLDNIEFVLNAIYDGKTAELTLS